MGRRKTYRVLVGKLEGERPLGRPRRRWEDNIKMDLQEVGCGGMDWIDQWIVIEIAQPGCRNPVIAVKFYSVLFSPGQQ
jgi:hypothetical protein